MSDLIERLRDADTTRRIGESYADTHERRQRDRDEAADRIQQLEAALREWVEADDKLRELMPRRVSEALIEGALIRVRDAKANARAALEGKP